MTGRTLLPCDQEIETAVRTTASCCEALGHEVEETSYRFDLEAFADDFLILWSVVPNRRCKAAHRAARYPP